MWRSSLLLLVSAVQAQQYNVSTVAGGVPPATPVAALQASIESPGPVVADGTGNIYFGSANCVFKVDAKGVLTRVAGIGRPGYFGDNGPAVVAQLSSPSGLALDASGNLYIADRNNARVRKIAPSGIITTVAGTGQSLTGYPVTSSPATSVPLGLPVGVALDSNGNLYVADLLNLCVWRVSPAGILTNFAGNHSIGYIGDGGPAVLATLYFPSGVATDRDDNVYIADTNNLRIRKVSSDGTISTVPGSFVPAQILRPVSVAIDNSKNVYFGTGENSIAKVTPSGTYVTVTGSALEGFSGDGGNAANATVCNPSGVTIDTGGNVYFADNCNNRVRKISASGLITTVAGDGTAGFSGDGDLATNAQLSSTTAIATNLAGNLYIADAKNSRVRMVNSAGVISTVAGNGVAGFSGDGGPAADAQLSSPSSLAIDANSNLYISDNNIVAFPSGIETLNQVMTSRIRKVSPTGTITTIAGSGPAGDTGDGGQATGAQINAGPIAVDGSGNLYFADNVDAYIRKISAAGTISTITRTDLRLISSHDGIPAANAYVNNVSALTTDALGNLFLSVNDYKTSDNRVREIVSSSGLITSVAGNPGYLDLAHIGDGGPATDASLYNPAGIALDSSGNLFISDEFNHRVRRVSPDRTITTIAGNGTFGHSGDGGLGLNAQMQPGNLALGANGRIYFTDGNVVRVLTPTGCKYSTSTKSLQVPMAGGRFPVDVSTGAGCLWTVGTLPDWISISGALSFSGAATVTVAVSTSAVPRTAYLSIAGVNVSVHQPSDLLLLSTGGVVNSASYGYSGFVAAGSIVSVFGNFLHSDPVSVAGFPLPTNLGGLSLQFSGAPLAPLFYVNVGQVNAQVPWEFAQGTITASIDGQTGAPITVSVAKYAPGLYSINGQGSGQGAILDANYRLVDSTNPAAAGSTVVQIFCTGLGPVTNQPATGAPAPSSPLAQTTTLPVVTIGDVPATVQFSGLTPGFAGLYQVNVLVPAQVAGTPEVPVILSIGDVQANSVTIAVK